HRSPVSSRSCTVICSGRCPAMPPSTRCSATRRRSWCEGSMSYRLEIGTALLLAVAIAIGIWAANRKERTADLDFRTSTYINRPRGSKALHDVLTRLGRLSERRRTPLYTLATERARRPAILVLLNPVIDLQDAELEQVT